ncbi:MAG: GNAT family N-acetyltransferase [Lachnospiraceae bacterium]|nr:GNAT family N-acetyltransferase [Lachnospiraceae bacterium]
MVFKEFAADHDLLSLTAPEDVLEEILEGGSEHIMIGGFDDGALICYALFSHTIGETKDVWLNYIFTAEHFRETGKATELLSYSADFLRKLGVVNILVRIVALPEQALDVYHFFGKRRYIPLELTGRLLIYRVRDMMDAGVLQMLDERVTKLPPMVGYEEARKIIGFADLPFNIKPFEREFSRFLISDGKVAACAICSLDEEILTVSDLYLDEKAKKQGFFVLILYSVITGAKEIVGDKLILKLCLNDDGAFNGLLQMFNPPDEEYLVQEYMNCLVLGD